MKYAVLFIALLFAGCDEGSSTEETPSTDGGYETFTMAMVAEAGATSDMITMQIAKEDFPNSMNWDDAMDACQNLGNGWRLPSKEELEEMYSQLHKQGKGNFKNDWYWSNSEYRSGYAYGVTFGRGSVWDCTKNFNGRVRAVREYTESLNPSMNEELNRAAENYGSRPSQDITQKQTFDDEIVSISGTTIQVAKEDFPSTMNWDDAMAACQGLGNGWRLPSKDELLAIYEQLAKETWGINNFEKDFYWSSSQDYSGRAWLVDFSDGSVMTYGGKSDYRKVRAVRNK